MKKNNRKPKVTVLIPAHNEGKVLSKVIASVLKIHQYDIKLLVVISDKASEATKKEAKKSVAEIINIGEIAGKGIAVRQAIPYIKTKYVVQIDAYQFLPEEIPLMVEPLLSGYQVVLGTRYQKGSHVDPDSVTYLKLIGSYGLSFITSIFAGKRVTDVMAGYKAFHTNILKNLNPQTDHFGYEAELVVRAAKRKYKIINVPISYKKRVVGSSSVSSIKHGFLVLETILRTAFEK
jgi:glycosyltransferase involved in cell wall biosynthesis